MADIRIVKERGYYGVSLDGETLGLADSYRQAETMVAFYHSGRWAALDLMAMKYQSDLAANLRDRIVDDIEGRL